MSNTVDEAGGVAEMAAHIRCYDLNVSRYANVVHGPTINREVKL